MLTLPPSVVSVFQQWWSVMFASFTCGCACVCPWWPTQTALWCHVFIQSDMINLLSFICHKYVLCSVAVQQWGKCPSVVQTWCTQAMIHMMCVLYLCMSSSRSMSYESPHCATSLPLFLEFECSMYHGIYVWFFTVRTAFQKPPSSLLPYRASWLVAHLVRTAMMIRDVFATSHTCLALMDMHAYPNEFRITVLAFCNSFTRHVARMCQY